MSDERLIWSPFLKDKIIFPPSPSDFGFAHPFLLRRHGRMWSSFPKDAIDSIQRIWGPPGLHGGDVVTLPEIDVNELNERFNHFPFLYGNPVMSWGNVIALPKWPNQLPPPDFGLPLPWHVEGNVIALLGWWNRHPHRIWGSPPSCRTKGWFDRRS